MSKRRGVGKLIRLWVGGQMAHSGYTNKKGLHEHTDGGPFSYVLWALTGLTPRQSGLSCSEEKITSIKKPNK